VSKKTSFWTLKNNYFGEKKGVSENRVSKTHGVIRVPVAACGEVCGVGEDGGGGAGVVGHSGSGDTGEVGAESVVVGDSGGGGINSSL